MANNIINKPNNFIDPSVFLTGVHNTILNPKNIFLVLYGGAEESFNVLAASTDIANQGLKKLSWTPSETATGGGTLNIDTIPPEETKDYIESGNHKAEYFAIITCEGTTPGKSGIEEKDPGHPEKPGEVKQKYFPNFISMKPLITGKLSAPTIISKETNFQFNKSNISFQVQ